MKKHSRLIAFIAMFVSLIVIVLAALLQYDFNGILFAAMIICMGCVAYLLKHDFTI
jgi:hypothetical protein